MVAFLVVVAGCARQPATTDGPRIAVLFDASWGDADEVAGPTLAGIRFAARGTGNPETVQPLNVGDDAFLEVLREVAADPAVVAAVVAPWTAPVEGAGAILAEAGMPVVSLTWAWGPTGDRDAYLRLAPDLRAEAELLVAGGGPAAGTATPRCVAGDPHPTSGPLRREVVEVGDRAGGTIPDVGVVDPERPATANAVAARLERTGCRVVLWTGGGEALELLVDAAIDLRTVVATSRSKTDGGIGIAVIHPARRIVAVCACADVTLTRRPELQRFIHDFQTESAGAPGAFAIEAYDVGRWLLGLAGEGRDAVASRVELAGALTGILGTYRIDAQGSLLSPPTRPGSWRASGSRWLPLGRPDAPPLVSALLVGPLVARVRPKVRRNGAPFAIDQGGEA